MYRLQLWCDSGALPSLTAPAWPRSLTHSQPHTSFLPHSRPLTHSLCSALLCVGLHSKSSNDQRTNKPTNQRQNEFAALHFALLCVALRCVVLLCVALRCFALLCVALRCFALLCVALRCVVLCCGWMFVFGCCRVRLPRMMNDERHFPQPQPVASLCSRVTYGRTDGRTDGPACCGCGCGGSCLACCYVRGCRLQLPLTVQLCRRN